jgi:hypothetical protein
MIQFKAEILSADKRTSSKSGKEYATAQFLVRGEKRSSVLLFFVPVQEVEKMSEMKGEEITVFADIALKGNDNILTFSDWMA